VANIKVNYMYRDASNYKKWASIVLENPQALSVQAFEARFLNAVKHHQLFADVQHFKPEDFGWETAYFNEHDPESSEDLDLHELCDIELTNEQAAYPMDFLN
jgi:hypothetical protein